MLEIIAEKSPGKNNILNYIPEAPPAPEPKKEPTAEEIEQAKKEMLQTMGYAPADPVEPEKEEVKTEEPEEVEETEEQKAEREKKEKEEAKAKEEKEAEKLESAKKKTKIADPAVAPVDAEAIAQKAAEKAIELSKKEEPKKVEPVVDPTASLTPEDRADYEAFLHLEKTNEKYKGRAAEHLKFVTKDYPTYQAAWEQKNPGQEFNPDAEEHESFFAKNEPQFEESELEAAKDDVKFEKRYQAKKSIEQEAQKPEIVKQRIAEKRPEIVKKIATGVGEFIAAVDPEAAKLVVNEQGYAIMDEAGVAKLTEHDKFLSKQIQAYTAELAPVLAEIEKVTDPDIAAAGYRFDAQTNAIHHEIAILAHKAEIAMLEDGTGLVRDGKNFLPSVEMAQKLNACRSEAEQASVYDRFWCLDGADLKRIAVVAYTGKAKAKISEMNDFYESRSKKSAQKETPEPIEEVEKRTEPPKPSVKPPSTGGSDVVTTTHTAPKNAKSFGEAAVGVLFG